MIILEFNEQTEFPDFIAKLICSVALLGIVSTDKVAISFIPNTLLLMDKFIDSGIIIEDFVVIDISLLIIPFAIATITTSLSGRRA